ncbi:MAG TPA: TetR/AcrR family transcriptional regulator [Acidimicrobiales bacterium]|nr:TetR/AcrR family transcriptional regulator [Acidimicrobiales bacterium]
MPARKAAAVTRPAAGSRRQGGPSGRTPWGTISRDQVIATAVRVLEEVGFEQLTIRGLASEMGVAPMSLYRHVRDKDDIIDEVTDRLLARVWAPAADPSDWRAYIAEAADRLRDFLVTEPAALHVYLSHPVMSPSARDRMDAMMEVLRTALGDEQAARRAYGALQTYTIGFAALEASRAGWAPSEDGDELAVQLAAYTSPSQFARGLHYLLAGLESGSRTPPAAAGGGQTPCWRRTEAMDS